MRTLTCKHKTWGKICVKQNLNIIRSIIVETLVKKNKEKLLKLDQMTDGAPGTDHLG